MVVIENGGRRGGTEHNKEEHLCVSGAGLGSVSL